MVIEGVLEDSYVLRIEVVGVVVGLEIVLEDSFSCFVVVEDCFFVVVGFERVTEEEVDFVGFGVVSDDLDAD